MLIAYGVCFFLFSFLFFSFFFSLKECVIQRCFQLKQFRIQCARVCACVLLVTFPIQLATFPHFTSGTPQGWLLGGPRKLAIMIIPMSVNLDGEHSPLNIPLRCSLTAVKRTNEDNGYSRTGITVKEGKRDEHGMEDIDGMWSSPEKSPVRENGFSDGNESSVGSDGMSMDEGTYNRSLM